MAPGRSRLVKWLPLWLLLVGIATVAAALLQDRYGDHWWLNIVRAIPLSIGVVFVVHMEDRQRRRSAPDTTDDDTDQFSGPASP